MSEHAESVSLNQERQLQAKEYARIRRQLTLFNLLLTLAYLVMWLATGLHRSLGEWVEGSVGSPFLAILLYAAVFGLPYMIIDLPMSYYSGFVLPHRYGQSNQSLGDWIGDQLKGMAIGALLGGLVLEVIYWLLRAAPDLWWLYAGGVMLLFTAVLSELAPVLIMPLFYDFTPLEDEDLAARLKNLAEQQGIEVKGVFRFDMSTKTKSANAAVMGLGGTRRIVLGDTLLDEFTPDEIETVLAHELAHIVHNDMPILIAFNSALTLFSFWVVHQALTWAVGALGLTGIADPAGLPVFMLTVSVIGLIAMPAGNAFSRWRERMADSFALKTTDKPEAFADAMTRLANQNLGEYDPERWVVVLLYSHPPIADRVSRAQRHAGAQP